jgi:hypothetical protein
MIHCLQWKKINDLPTDTFALRHGSDALWPLTRGRGRLLHEGWRVAIEQRNASHCTTDRCSDIFKDRLQPRTFNLKQRTIEEAG